MKPINHALPVKSGLGFMVDKNWNPIMARDREHAEKLGYKYQHSDSKKFGFMVSVFEADDYYRISYGRKT